MSFGLVAALRTSSITFQPMESRSNLTFYSSSAAWGLTQNTFLNLIRFGEGASVPHQTEKQSI